MGKVVEIFVGVNAIAGVSVAIVTLVGVSSVKRFVKRITRTTGGSDGQKYR